MDYIAGSFYDGFLLYAMALEETLAEGGAQNDGISITMKTQNRHIWGKKIVVTYLNLWEQNITILLILLQSVGFLLLLCAAITYGNLTYRACPHISGYFSMQLLENI